MPKTQRYPHLPYGRAKLHRTQRKHEAAFKLYSQFQLLRSSLTRVAASRIFAVLGVEVLRLVRVAIGPLALGTLAKGEWRLLTAAEVRSLGPECHPGSGRRPIA